MNIGLTLAAALESLYLSGRRMFSRVCECLVPQGLHKAPSCQAMHILSKKLDLLAHKLFEMKTAMIHLFK